MEIADNSNSIMCKECGGKCCKSLSGINHPDDFNNDINKMREALNKDYCIDCYEDDNSMFYIRPRLKNALDKKVDYSWGGECYFYDKGFGCSIKFVERPYECRKLIPNFGSCGDDNTKLECANWWEKYQMFLREEL